MTSRLLPNRFQLSKAKGVPTTRHECSLLLGKPNQCPLIVKFSMRSVTTLMLVSSSLPTTGLEFLPTVLGRACACNSSASSLAIKSQAYSCACPINPVSFQDSRSVISSPSFLLAQADCHRIRAFLIGSRLVCKQVKKLFCWNGIVWRPACVLDLI